MNLQDELTLPWTRGEADFDVIMLSKDEETNISHSLKSVIGWARRVFVVDSGSVDRTCDIARSLGATVVTQTWLGYSRQKNWAIDSLPLEASWVLILDADESVMDDLRSAIDGVVSQPSKKVEEAGFLINRYFVFLGKRINHCGYYPSYNLRLFRRGLAHYEDREVHEHMVVEGKIGYLPGHLEHYDRRGLEAYMAKHNRYSTLEAKEIFELLNSDQKRRLDANLLGDPLQRRRWIKEHVYPRLPAKWLWRFGFMYFLRGGVFDGVVGLRFSLFMSAYELLVELKLKELEQVRGR